MNEHFLPQSERRPYPVLSLLDLLTHFCLLVALLACATFLLSVAAAALPLPNLPEQLLRLLALILG